MLHHSALLTFPRVLSIGNRNLSSLSSIRVAFLGIILSRCPIATSEEVMALLMWLNTSAAGIPTESCDHCYDAIISPRTTPWSSSRSSRCVTSGYTRLLDIVNRGVVSDRPFRSFRSARCRTETTVVVSLLSYVAGDGVRVCRQTVW